MLNQLILFVRYPEPGRVKTRLAKHIGALQAAEFYKCMVERVVEHTQPLVGGFEPHLYFDPPEKSNAFKTWLPQLAHHHPQSPGDLGQRMAAAVAARFAAGANRVAIIGSDCLDVDHPLLMETFLKLNAADLVIGPAQDGGYYLLAMKQSHPGLFDDMEWGGPTVLARTLEKARHLKLQIDTLPVFSDVDTLADYQVAKERICD